MSFQSNEVARAAVVSVNMATEEVLYGATFTDDGTGMDPRFKCVQFWESIQADWPGWQASYVSNVAADELAKDRRLWSMGMSDDGPMAARIEAYNAEVEARR